MQALVSISMRPNLWFVNEKNKKPQKIFRKPKKRSKKCDYFIDFMGCGAYNENKLEILCLILF